MGSRRHNPTLIANATYENTPANLNVTTSWATYSVTANVDTASTTNIIVFIWSDVTDTTAGDFLYITNAQLEIGSTATPFERRLYNQELANCQRYFEVLGGRNTYEPVGIGFIFSSTTGVANYFFKQTMRTPPSLTVPTVGNWSVMNSAGSGIGLTSLVINDSGNQVTVNGVCLRCQVPSGLTAGNATSLESVNTNARMSFSAEL